jgi:hypothetical protein
MKGGKKKTYSLPRLSLWRELIVVVHVYNHQAIVLLSLDQLLGPSVAPCIKWVQL